MAATFASVRACGKIKLSGKETMVGFASTALGCRSLSHPARSKEGFKLKPCSDCGKEFEPKTHMQTRCDDCINIGLASEFRQVPSW